MKTFPLSIVTPDCLLFQGEAERLLVRTREGDMEILPGHTDLVAVLGTGRAALTAGGQTRYAAASGGFLTVTGDTVRLVCTTFEFADTIDRTRAQAARERAEEALRVAKDSAAIDLAKAKLSRALSRLSVSDML